VKLDRKQSLYLLAGCNDVLVVLGGFGNQQMPVDTVEKFDPKTQEWQPLPVCASLQLFTPPPIWEWSIVMSMSVCVCTRVYLSVIISSELHSDLCGIFCACYLCVGSVLLWWRSDMLRISGFMDDVIFARELRLLDVAARLGQ